MAMASTTSQLCTSLQCRGWDGSNSSSRVVATNSQRTVCGGFKKMVANARGRRGAGRYASGEPVAVLRSLSKSSLFGGPSVDSSRRNDKDVFQGCSNWEGANGSRAARPVHAVQAMPGNVEMLEAYEIERKVRDYELDHYGVVNNAIYAQFCQQARTELLENIGFRPDGVTESGKSMAISDMTMKFVSPLRSGDRYIVSSRIAATTAVRLIFEDHIYRLPERELVMSAKSTVLVLDQNAKPGRLPDEIKIKLVAGYSTNCHVKPTKYGPVHGTVSTSTHGNGKSTNGHSNGNSTKAHVNGSSEKHGQTVNGHSGNVNGSLNAYINDNLVNSFVNGNSTTDPLTGHLTTEYVNGSAVNGHDNGKSTIGHLNGISSSSHMKPNSTTDSLNVKDHTPNDQANGDAKTDSVKGISSDITYN
ncbi:unnamed protein product [Calypogeia fissa]